MESCDTAVTKDEMFDFCDGFEGGTDEEEYGLGYGTVWGGDG